MHSLSNSSLQELTISLGNLLGFVSAFRAITFEHIKAVTARAAMEVLIDFAFLT